jgi:hypothetical protein
MLRSWHAPPFLLAKGDTSLLTRQSHDWLLLRAAHRDREAVQPEDVLGVLFDCCGGIYHWIGDFWRYHREGKGKDDLEVFGKNVLGESAERQDKAALIV